MSEVWICFSAAQKGIVELSDYDDNDESDDDDDDDYGSQGNKKIANNDQRRPLIRRISGSENLSSQGRQAVEYLHAIDDDVRGVVSAVAALRANTDTIDASVTCRRQRYDSLTFWGFDCGIRWSTAIIIVVVVAIAVPFLCIVYYILFHSHHNS